MTDRKRLLYVERYYSESANYGRYLIVLEGLKQEYDVEAEFDLSQHTVRTVKNALADRPFAAIVTHVPNDPGLPSYGQSFQILHELRTLVDVPIIAYTGADGMVLLSIESYADAVIKKSADSRRDLVLILSYLTGLLERRNNPPVVPLPAIHREGGLTTVEVKVNLPGGLGIREMGKVREACRDFGGKVTIQRLGEASDSHVADGRNFFDLLCLNAFDGSELRISVEGSGPKAERLVQRLYEGIAFGCPRDMEMEQLNKTKEK